MFNLKTLIILVLFFKAISFVAQEKIEFTTEESQWIKNHPVVDFGYEPNWPPYEIYKNGEYSGIVGDYIKLIEEYTGIDMKPIPGITWEESISKLRSGDIHIVPIAGITDYRKNYLEFTKPYISDPLVIVTRHDFQFISGLNDLENKKICLPKGYYTIDMIKKDFPNIKIVTSSSIKKCLLDVSTSRVDAFVGSLSVISYYINNYGFSNLKIAAPTEYNYTQMGFAVTKDWHVFRDIVQKVFDVIPQKQHNSIKNKWILVKYDLGVNKAKIKSYIMYGALALIIIFIGFYVWNYTLRKQIKHRKKAESELNNSLVLIHQKNSEKDVLLKEIHHRVKNNLQMVYSLLNMQSREVLSEDALLILAEGKARVKAMALVHQILYESDNLSKVDLRIYIDSLKDNIININHDDNKDVKVFIHVNDVSLDLEKVIPFGLILNELLTNSYKHAFKGRNSGEIHISIKKEKGMCFFKYTDNGVGMNNLDIEYYKTLGMRLINRLSNQLNTQAILKNNNGLMVTFAFN
jgi:two-component sensor histidine kinase/ABC-type amino acid transport substrate-binding protein